MSKHASLVLSFLLAGKMITANQMQYKTQFAQAAVNLYTQTQIFLRF